MKTSLAYIHLTKINLLFINRTKGYWLNYLTYMASLEFEKPLIGKTVLIPI